MKQILEEAAEQELSRSYASIVDGKFIYQAGAMINMFRKGAEWADACHNNPWTSVKDRLPEIEQEVLLYDKDSICHYIVGCLREKRGYNESKWRVTNGYVFDESITHWMPIVEPK